MALLSVIRRWHFRQQIPIHEGTTGIQALDLLGRKILRDGGRVFAKFAGMVADAAQAAPANFTGEAAALRGAVAALTASLEVLRGANDETEMMGNATNFLRAFGHTVVGFIWLSLVTALPGAALLPEAADGKRAAARFFFAFEIPHIAAWLAPINAGTRLTVTVREGCL